MTIDVEAGITKVREESGTACDIDRPVAEYEGWHFGERVRVIEDDEEAGAFEGDEGWLTLEMVGAPEHGNERVSAGFLGEGMADPIEISLDSIEAM